MRLAVIVPFLNEADLLPVFLASVDAQTRRPDLLLLVDDGSTDGSEQIVASFADDHDYARVMRRPVRPPVKDRLITAPEFKAFLWGLDGADGHEVVVKMDADLLLRPNHFETLMDEMEADDRLGLVGAYLAAETDGVLHREWNPEYHVRGPNKFYRRACLDEILPIPEIPGWETIDELTARMKGWRTTSVALPGGDSIHLRPTGSRDGVLRGFRRHGLCAWSAGTAASWVALGAVHRFRERPHVLGGLHYFAGWFDSAVRRRPRAGREVRRFAHREQHRLVVVRLRRFVGRHVGSDQARP